MPKFRKKPIVIEAIQWLGSLNAERHVLIDFAGDQHLQFHGDVLRVPTLEGVMEAYPGDWIIKGVKGEIYPCKPDIFAALYDPEATEDQP